MSDRIAISVRECVNKVIRAEDCVSTNLEILEVLPPEQMAGLLSDELERRGFQRERDGTLVRRGKGTAVTVDPAKGTVTVRRRGVRGREGRGGRRDGRSFEEAGRHAQGWREALREELRARLAEEGRRDRGPKCKRR